jgi:hypothetical protein
VWAARWRIADMLSVRRDTRRDQVRPTQPLEFRRGLPVVQAGIVAAFAADELEPVGVTAAPTKAGRLAPQDHRPAKRVLTFGRVSTMRRGPVRMPPGSVQSVDGYLLVHMSRSMRDYWPLDITLPGVTRAPETTRTALTKAAERSRGPQKCEWCPRRGGTRSASAAVHRRGFRQVVAVVVGPGRKQQVQVPPAAFGGEGEDVLDRCLPGDREVDMLAGVPGSAV